MNAHDPAAIDVDASTTTPSAEDARPESAVPLAEQVRAFVALISERFECHADALTAAQLRSAQLAVAVVDAIIDLPSDAVEQIVVFGPTQAGKSTLTNALLGVTRAGVSPLAGFTIHVAGFYQAGTAAPDADSLFAQADRDRFNAAQQQIATLLKNWRQVDYDELSRTDCMQYALEQVTGAPESPGVADRARGTTPERIVWDTPDVDSVSAAQYEAGVLRLIAVMGVGVVALSKEKYADQVIWDWVKLIAPLKVPLVFALNKLAPDMVDPLRSALEELIAEHVSAGAPTAIVPILQTDDRNVSPSDIDALRGAIKRQRALARGPTPEAACRLISTHLPSWRAPLAAEWQACDDLRADIDQLLDELLLAYQRDYLDHPQRFDGLRRATLGLLQLLEVPVVGSGIARVRQVVTWPARQAWRAGQRWIQGESVNPALTFGEQAFLEDALRNLTKRFEERLIARAAALGAGGVIARVVRDKLRAAQADLEARFAGAADAHHHAVEEAVRAAARDLHQELAKSPAALNGLRAARVTLDAAGLALAVKTGGVPLADLMLAPALLGVTSLLAEGAVGVYLERVITQLKQRQHAAAQTELVAGALRPAFEELVADMQHAELIGIDPQVWQDGVAAIDAWHIAEGQVRA